jgi:hypothetical protein
MASCCSLTLKEGPMAKLICYFCGEELKPYQPGTSLNEEFGPCHTDELYKHYGEEVPGILK